MKKRIITGILTISTVVTMAQQNLTPEKLWQLGRVNAEAVSIQNNNVIYSITNYDMSENKGIKKTFSISLKDKKTHQISKDNQSISIVNIDKYGKIIYLNEGQIWMMNSDGSDTKQLTNFEGGLDNVRISPDGKHILFTKEVLISKTLAKDKYTDLPKSNAFIYDDLNYRHWDTWQEGKVNHVFYATYNDGVLGEPIDILQGEPYDSPQKPFGGKEDAIWAPNGKSILYVSKKKTGKEYAQSTNTDIYEYHLETKQTKNITPDNLGYDTNPVFSPNGNFLAWTSMKEDGYESDKNDINILDLKTNKKYNLTHFWDETVSSFCFSNDNSKIYFIAVEKATQQIFEISLNKDLSKNSSKNIRKITNGTWDINAIAGELNGKLIVNKTDINRAAELYTVDVKTGKLTQLTAVNDSAYKDIAKSKVEERWVKTTDGHNMLTWVIFPPNFDPNKKYPTLLYCQGGPQSAVSQFYSFRWNFQLMAAQGYIVVAPNRSGLPGFGVEWNRKISGDWGGQPMKDYLAAIDDVAKESYVDKNRLGCVGASYGGYSVYMLAGIHEGRFKSFIAHNGLFDLKSWYGTTEELFFANKDIGGSYWDSKNDAIYEKFSPSNYIKNWNTPILIFQGGKDYRVPIEQGQQAFQAAQLKSIKSRLVFFPEENHWIIKAQNSIVWQREFFNWLKETL